MDGGRDRLLTVRQVAERLGVSTATVYTLVAGGELAHVRVSNAIRVAPADLAAYVTLRTKVGQCCARHRVGVVRVLARAERATSRAR